MALEHTSRTGEQPDWKNLTLFLMTLSAIVICLLMLRPFLPAIVGAVVLAVVTQRPHQWIRSRLKNVTLAAGMSLLLVSLSIIGPTVFFVQRIVQHVLTAIHSFQNGTVEREYQAFLERSPHVAAALQYWSDNISVNQAMEKSAGFVGARMVAVLGGSISTLMQIVVMLFLLFFLYRDKELGLATLRSIVPLKESETDYFLSHITDTVNATVLGRFVVAAVQGLVAGITFASLGVSGAITLGTLTALFAMVPSFGAFVVWLPVAVYLVASNHWIQAIILVCIGSLIISTLDNVFYPILVGTQLRLHTVPIFLSILGGIWLFGVSGLVLGPILFSLTESLLVIWHRRLVEATETRHIVVP